MHATFRLMVDLMAYQELPSADSGVWKEGDFCVAQYTVDLLWYRAKIMGCLSDSARFEVGGDAIAVCDVTVYIVTVCVVTLLMVTVCVIMVYVDTGCDVIVCV